MEEKKEIRISLSTIILIVALVIIIALIGYIYTLKNNENVEKQISVTNKSISGWFAQSMPGDEEFWFDSGDYHFKDDGTVENVSSATKSGVYTIDGNIINIHFTEVEGVETDEHHEFLIKDDNTLLSLYYEKSDDSPAWHVSGTMYFRQENH